jgi:hypothetical protein
MTEITFEFLQELQSALLGLDIDEIKQRISARMDGRDAVGLEMPVGTYLYRARRIDSSFYPQAGLRIRDLSYPPRELSKAGRLNRAGNPVFYCSTSKSPLLFELNAKPGDEFIFSIWRTNEICLLSGLGYSSSVFQALGAQRNVPIWLQGRPRTPPSDLRDLLSEVFAEKIFDGMESKYKLTAAIAELHWGPLEGGARQYAGVLYPSVAMRANGDNIALLPWFVDSNLVWTKSMHILVEAVEEQSFSIKDLDKSLSLGEDGKLVWAGRAGTVLSSPGPFKFVFTAGKDELGDYILGKNNFVGHWLGTDEKTGRSFTA